MSVRTEMGKAHIYPHVLLVIAIISCLTTSGQGGVLLNILQPSAEDRCDGRMKVVSIIDCGVPEFELCSSLHGVLTEGMVVSRLCHADFTLSWTDRSGETIGETITPNWGGNRNKIQSDFNCFDSTYYRPNVYIYGVVKRSTDLDSLVGVHVSVDADNGDDFTIVTDSSGAYELTLPLFDSYVLSYSKVGHYTKRLACDARMDDPWKVGAGYSMKVDMSMIPLKAGLDLMMLDSPISKTEWSAGTGRFEWDLERAARIAKEIEVALEKAED